jgi:Ankyrin repeats (3 copies)/Fic/DOC family
MANKTSTNILSTFTQKRSANYLTDTIIHPSHIVKLGREQSREAAETFLMSLTQKQDKQNRALESLKDQKHVVDAWGFSRSVHSTGSYDYYLDLGATHLILENYKEAAEAYKKAMAFPKINQQAETDDLLELPCLLAGACLELSGDYQQAMDTYQEGLDYHFKSAKGKKDYQQSIARCQQKLDAKETATPVEYLPEYSNPLLTQNEQGFSKNRLYQTFDLDIDSSQTISFNQLVEKCFNGFNPANSWRLAVDGTQQKSDNGWLGWEAREPNSISAMKKVFDYIYQYGDEPITVNTLRQIHTLAVKEVGGLNGRANHANELVKPGAFRTTEVGLRISLGFNATEDGLNYLLKLTSDDQYYSVGEQRGYSRTGTANFHYRAQKIPESALIEKAEKAINEYYDTMTQLDGRDNYVDVIKAIVKCVKDIELAHIFRDGNGRTTYALLNLMLVQNHLPPVILEDPNFFDGYSIDEMVDEVLKGMENFHHVKHYNTYPGAKSNADVLKDEISSKRDDLISEFKSIERYYLHLLRNCESAKKKIAEGDEYGSGARKLERSEKNLKPYQSLDFETLAARVNQAGNPTEDNQLLSKIKTTLKHIEKKTAFDTLEQDFMRVVSEGQVDLMQNYIDAGFDINFTDPFGNTPLAVAAYHGQAEIVAFLLSIKAGDINHIGQSHTTALYLAAYKGHGDIVSYLLEHGANPHLKSEFGLSPAKVAEQNGDQSIAAVIHDKKKDYPQPMEVDDETSYAKTSIFFRGISTSQDVNKLESLLASKSFLSLAKALPLLAQAKEGVFHYQVRWQDLIEKINSYLASPSELIKDIEQRGSVGAFKKDYIRLKQVVKQQLELSDKLDDTSTVRLNEMLVKLDDLIIISRVRFDSTFDDLLKMIQANQDIEADAEQTFFDLLENHSLLLGHFLTSSSMGNKIEVILKRFPQHERLLVETLIAKGFFKGIHKDVYSLNSVLGKFKQSPDIQQAIFNEVFATDERLDVYSENSSQFFDLAQTFQGQNDRLLNWLLSDDERFSKMVNGSYHLRNALNAFDGKTQQEQVLTKVLMNDSLWEQMFSKIYDYKNILAIVPEYRQVFFTRMLEQSDITKTPYDLNQALELFNSQEEQTILLMPVLENDELFAHFFDTSYHIFDFIKTAPFIKDLVLDKLIEKPDSMNDLLEKYNGLLELIEQFDAPEQQRKIMTFVFQDPKLAKKCFKSDSNIQSVFSKLKDAESYIKDIAKDDEYKELFETYLKHEYPQVLDKLSSSTSPTFFKRKRTHDKVDETAPVQSIKND